MRNYFLLMCLFFGCLIESAAQNDALILQQLLDYPAPPAAFGNRKIEKYERPAGFFELKNQPPDDAPINDLLDFWAHWQETVYEADSRRVGRTRPSPVAMRRIVEALRQQPEKTNDYYAYLTDSPEHIELVRNSLAAISGDKSKLEAAKSLDYWLMINTDTQLEELAEYAADAGDNENLTTNETELFALARLDWKRAEPILRRLESDYSNKVSRVSAMWAIYAHAVKSNDQSQIEKYRAELKAIVTDSSQPSSVRDKALDALILGGAWDGRDEWYLSLLSDESLYLLEDEETTWTGLTTLPSVEAEEKWIPIFLKLLNNNPNQTIRNAVVRNLMEMELTPTREVLLPLLPWLDDPKWAKSPDDERAEFIKMLRKADVPESVPGLLNVVMNEPENLLIAVDALGRYKDTRAIPVLRSVIGKVSNEDQDVIVAALVEIGGFSIDEQVASIEFEAQLEIEKENSKFNSIPKNLELLAQKIARYVTSQTTPNEDLIARIYERARELRNEKPDIANYLIKIAQKWQSRVVALNFVQALETNQIDAPAIVEMLARRESIRVQVPDELAATRDKNPLANGVSAVILADEREIYEIFDNPKKPIAAKIALLAAARLIHTPLPLGKVAADLKAENKLLVLAAERYLETEDSPAAQKILANFHTDKIHISGAFSSFDPANLGSQDESLKNLFRSLNFNLVLELWRKYQLADEEKWRAEFQTNANLQTIHALADNQNQIVRVYRDYAVFAIEDTPARFRDRRLTVAELNAWQDFLAQNPLETVKADLSRCLFDCSSTEFVSLNRRAGRRVYLGQNNFITGYDIKNSKLNVVPTAPNFAILLDDFQNYGEFQWHYRIQEKISNVEILIADEMHAVKAVWAQDGDVRVLVEEVARKNAELAQLKILEAAEDELLKDSFVENGKHNEMTAARKARRAEIETNNSSWRNLTAGKLGEIAATPPIDASQFGRINSAGSTIENQTTIQTVTPDGKWQIGLKNGKTLDAPRVLVRINQRTKQEFVINIADADVLRAVGFNVQQNKILIRRAESPHEWEKRPNAKNPIAPEYFLLDAATGALQNVRGDFRPLEQHNPHPLQPSQKSGTYYAVVADREKNQTILGFYDSDKFAFQKLLELPDIYFENQDFWIDETGGKIYVVYGGQLLAIPLPIPKLDRE